MAYVYPGISSAPMWSEPHHEPARYPIAISTAPMEWRIAALAAANAALTNPTPAELLAYARELLPWIAKGDAPDETP